MSFWNKKITVVGCTFAWALGAQACMGFDVGPEGEGEVLSLEEQEQELSFGAFDQPDELALPGGPDLIGEILYCNDDTIAFAIRNQGTVTTDAQSCGMFGCFPSIKTWVYTGERQRTFYTGNLAPGQEEIRTFEKPPGMEGFRAWIRVDVWGGSSGDGSVTETNENNNFTSGYCIY